MFPLMYVHYFGEVQITYWECMLGLLYVLGMYLYFAREKNRRIKTAPEYRYFLWGLFAKLFGGVAFSLIYLYYYQGGDTIAYFFSAAAMRNMALADPLEYLTQFFGDNTMRAWSVYTLETAKPYQYVFLEDRTFAVIRVMSIIAMFTFNSYLISTLVIASLSYFGVWASYRTFVSYYPQLAGKLATGFLFMPSSIFWGSAILKDTFTFSAVCWWVFAVDEVFFKKRKIVHRSIVIAISGITLVVIKPYIFMVLFPATVMWILYFRVAAMRSGLLKFAVLPLAVVLMIALSIVVLNNLGDQLDKFALDEALTTIQVTQSDLSNAQSYGSNSFSVGSFDGTWLGVLMKFPVATNAALFRPYIWEATSPIMAISGLENLWVLLVAGLAVLRAGPHFFLRCIGGVPILLMATTFALLFGFTVGVTTPNFGALVRFKIPLVPFFISVLYIIVYLGQLKRAADKTGQGFVLQNFRMGTGHLVEIEKAKRRRRFMSNVRDPGPRPTTAPS
ncbi:MAG: hypothetical protein JNL43_09325 [Flavobacteriales bacterium]|nr:hypothetical protein [Flavobacteriales bacterium]